MTLIDEFTRKSWTSGLLGGSTRSVSSKILADAMLFEGTPAYIRSGGHQGQHTQQDRIRDALLHTFLSSSMSNTLILSAPPL
jgi:hypothetical protein